MPAQQVSISALWSIAVRIACRNFRSSLNGALALLNDSTTSPLVVPSMTSNLSLLVNCANDSGAWTVPTTSMLPDSSALFSAVGSLKYLSTTVLKNGLVPQ